MNLKKTISAFNNDYIQYKIMGDKEKGLSIKEYVDIIGPYLNVIINNHKTQGGWKIHLTMAINFISSKEDSEKSDNIEIINLFCKDIKKD